LNPAEEYVSLEVVAVRTTMYNFPVPANPPEFALAEFVIALMQKAVESV